MKRTLILGVASVALLWFCLSWLLHASDDYFQGVTS